MPIGQTPCCLSFKRQVTKGIKPSGMDCKSYALGSCLSGRQQVLGALAFGNNKPNCPNPKPNHQLK